MKTFKKIILPLFLFIYLRGNSQFIVDTTIVEFYDTTQQFYKFKPNLNLTVTNLTSIHKENFRLNNLNSLIKIEELNDSLTMVIGKFYRYQQKFNGVIVEGGRLNIFYNSMGSPINANGSTFNITSANINPIITPIDAINSALINVPADKYYWQDSILETEIKIEKNDSSATYYPIPVLVILPVLIPTTNNYDFKLCYKIRISAFEPENVVDVFVDANSGLLVSKKQISVSCFHSETNCDDNAEIGLSKSLSSNMASGCSTSGCQNGSGSLYFYGMQSIKTEKFPYGILGTCTYRTKDNCTGTTLYTRKYQFPGAIITDHRDNTNNWLTSGEDKEGITAHWSLERTHDYFRTRYGRNSWDGSYSQLSLYTDWAAGGPNAAWTGNSIKISKKYTWSYPVLFLDGVGHEFTHGITQTSAYLTYLSESGALNEGFSDIFGTMIEFYGIANYSTSQSANYELNELSHTLRSMSNPKLYNQPDTYGGTNWADPTIVSYDKGGVHINSGVLNYWFYLLAEGSGSTDGINDLGNNFCVSAIGQDKATDIAWRTLTMKLYPSANYSNCMFLSIQSAIEIYGANSNEVAQVMAAWYAVGVDPYPQYGYGQIDIKNITINSPKSYHYNKKVSLQNVTTNPTAGLVVTSNTEIELINEISFNPGSENELYITPACLGGARIGNTNNSTNQNTENEQLQKKLESSLIAQNDFIVMPNPTAGIFKLLANNELEYPKQITVRNVLGQIIYNIENPNSFEIEFNLTNQDAGIYMINVYYNEKVLSKRVIKE